MKGLLLEVSPQLLHALRRTPPRVQRVVDGSDPVAARLELDQAWHGVAYLLCGATNPILGGRRLGDDPAWGPARFFTPTQVRDLIAAMDQLGRDKIEQRFDARRMSAHEIYPGGWSDAAAKPRLLAAVDKVRDFYGAAAARGHAVLVCVVASASACASARSAGAAR